MMVLHLRSDFVALYGEGESAFDHLMGLTGEVYRSVASRRTLCFQNRLGSFFIKIHQGVGWGEIFKNLAQLRPPILGADNEWRAIERLHRLGVDTMSLVGYGRRGLSPAARQSFVITEEITDATSLEDLTQDWATHPPDPQLKRRLIDKVAEIARTLHDHGLNHRDLYICHFLLDEATMAARTAAEMKLYLIDLHRVQMRRKTPRRWRVKDVAAIYFSAMDIGLTRRDLLRFVRQYGHGGLRASLKGERRFWRDVEARARRLYRSEWGRAAPSL